MEELVSRPASAPADEPGPMLDPTVAAQASRSRVDSDASARSSEGAIEPALRSAEQASPSSEADTLRWRQLLAGSPREVLSRIVQDDPLGVREHVALRLREQAHLLDADRVHLRSLARCARSAPRYHGRPDLVTWIAARIGEAIEDLLLEDFEAERDGAPPGSEPGAAFVALAQPLGLEPESMRRACVVFNQLPFEDRRAFFDLVIFGRALDDLVRETGRGATEIARRARRALDAIVPTPVTAGLDAPAQQAVQEEEQR